MSRRRLGQLPDSGEFAVNKGPDLAKTILDRVDPIGQRREDDEFVWDDSAGHVLPSRRSGNRSATFSPTRPQTSARRPKRLCRIPGADSKIPRLGETGIPRAMVCTRGAVGVVIRPQRPQSLPGHCQSNPMIRRTLRLCTHMPSRYPPGANPARHPAPGYHRQ